MGILAHVLRPSGLTPGEVVPMVPNLISSPQVLGKRALILINQTFLLRQSCRVLHPTANDLLSAFWLWLSTKWL
jgi:hypothetical protein